MSSSQEATATAIAQNLIQPPIRMQINTADVTDLHPLVFGDFEELRGSVAGLRGCITGLRGNTTNIFGDVTYLPRLKRGDISAAIELCTQKFAKKIWLKR